MHPYPHTYVASAAGGPSGLVPVASPGLPELVTAPPPQFDGPEGLWSPETFLAAAVANCFILTFRAVSRAAQMGWLRLECRVEAVLERTGRVTHFSRFTTHAILTVPAGVDIQRAQSLLEKAERECLVANSLRGTRTLEAQVIASPAAT